MHKRLWQSYTHGRVDDGYGCGKLPLLVTNYSRMMQPESDKQLNEIQATLKDLVDITSSIVANMVTKDEFYNEINPLKQDVSGLKQDVSGLKQDVSDIKDELVSVNGRLGMLERDMKDVKHELRLIDRRTQEDVDMVARDIVVLKQRTAI